MRAAAATAARGVGSPRLVDRCRCRRRRRRRNGQRTTATAFRTSAIIRPPIGVGSPRAGTLCCVDIDARAVLQDRAGRVGRTTPAAAALRNPGTETSREDERDETRQKGGAVPATEPVAGRDCRRSAAARRAPPRRRPARAARRRRPPRPHRSSPKRLPPKYFYDDRGSRLFEAICETAGVLSDPHRARAADRDRRRGHRRDAADAARRARQRRLAQDARSCSTR